MDPCFLPLAVMSLSAFGVAAVWVCHWLSKISDGVWAIYRWMKAREEYEKGRGDDQSPRPDRED